jgi:hypothetical protein
MVTITPEQRHEIEKAGEKPVQLQDPESQATYILLKTEVYERIRPLPQDEGAIPEGIRRSQEAFFRDLPGLLGEESLRGQWVAYRGDERVTIGSTQDDVIGEINRRGINDEEFDLFVIEPQTRDTEEVPFPSSWL